MLFSLMTKQTPVIEEIGKKELCDCKNVFSKTKKKTYENPNERYESAKKIIKRHSLINQNESRYFLRP